MALAAALIPGFTYKVSEGPLAGELVTIVDNVAIPDKIDGVSQDNKRKILVTVGNQPHYIIPRQIGGTPVNAHAPVFAPEPQRVPVIRPATDEKAITEFVEIGEYSPITDPMDVRLDHLRPSISKVKKYVNRTMPGGMTDVDFFLTFTNQAYRDENQGYPANIMLKGDTQGGKTFLVEVLAVAWAEQLGYPKPMPIFKLSASSGVTDYDLFGQPVSYYDPMLGIERIVWLPGTAAMAATVPCIFYIDECNALAERVTTSLHPFIDHTHTFTNRNKAVKVPGDGFMAETVVVNKDCWAIGTCNEGYRGMSEMNEAFVGRFRHFEWGYDKHVEQALVASPAISLLADAMRTARDGSKLRTPVGTATLQRLDLDVDSFGVALALEIFVSAFKPQERPVVRQILQDRSIVALLNEEVRSRAIQMTGV